jgi:tetratricopeptide (TPR) repeat protein
LLLALAKANQPIVPNDVNPPDAAGTADPDSAKVGALLALATIDNVCGRYAAAQAAFQFILKERPHNPSSSQLAYATFGLATALQNQGNFTAAREGCIAALNSSGKAAWQDEILYRLAGLSLLIKNPKGMVDSTQAMAYWAQLVKEDPDSPRAPIALYNLGMAYANLQQWDQAKASFNNYIAVIPKQPLAGAAYVRLLDIALANDLDLAAAATLLPAATAWVNGDKGAAANNGPQAAWRISNLPEPRADDAGTVYALLLRAGMTSYIANNPKAAADNFEKALHIAPASAADGLRRLIASARAGQPLLPADVQATGTADSSDAPAKAADPAATALGIGLLYHVLGQQDLAANAFNRLLANNPISSTPAEKAFASFGQGLVMQSRNQLTSARQLFDDSLKLQPTGTWQDQTIFNIATAIDHQAEAQYGQPAAPPPNSKNITERERDAAAQAEADRPANLAKAKSEALPYWKQLIDTFPQSPLRETAMYNEGLLLCQVAQAAPAAQQPKLWKDAAAGLNQFCQSYPKSPWAGNAYVTQADIALEELLDPKLARSFIQGGIPWVKAMGISLTTNDGGQPTDQSLTTATRIAQETKPATALWRTVVYIDPKKLLDDVYNLYLRAAIIAYLEGQYDEATTYIDAAGPARLTAGTVAGVDIQKLGLAILRNSCQRQQDAWYPDAIKAAISESQKFAIKLADTYLHLQRPEKAEAIYNQILALDAAQGPPSAGVEGYCYMQLALSYSMRNINQEKSIEYYRRFYQKNFEDLPYAADAILRLAVLEYNTTQDPHKSIPHYQYVLKKYPDHPDAERALYFLSLDAVDIGDKALAEASCLKFLEKYPQSGWAKHVQTVLNDEIPKMTTDKKGKNP